MATILKEEDFYLNSKSKYSNSSMIPDEESFIDDLYRDEMRSGFMVTSHRKKLWNVQIGLVNEVARICKKHNIHWFAYGGTLLGAVRHKGFIPWDDDVDLAMLRPDYEKFKQVAEKEIQPPYFLDNWYNHRLESEELAGIKSDPNLPLITLQNQQKQWFGYPACTMMKLRDSRTTMIEFPDRLNVNQGIWIDIAPFDPIPPFSNQKQAMIFETAKLILMATIHPDIIINLLKNGHKFHLPQKDLESIMYHSYKDKGIIYDNFVLENFSKSERVGFIDEHCYPQKSYVSFETRFFDNSIYMPFERIKIPVSVDWDDMLTSQFGDWRTPKIFQTHSVTDYSADIPYNEYLKKKMNSMNFNNRKGSVSLNNEKLITIGTTLYNKAPYLKDWAESLSKQTYLDKMHILVVDDCSTDNSLELLKKYVDEYHLPVEILRNEKNMGVVYSTQKIYSQLKTKYFAILDADDCYLSPEKIERAVNFLENHKDYSCCASNYISLFSDGRKTPIFPYPPPSADWQCKTYHKFREFPIFQSCSTVFRNFFTPEFLKKILQYPKGSPEVLADALEGEPFRFLMSARQGKLYFDNFIGSMYRCDVGVYGSSSEFEHNLENMDGYYKLFDFYKENFGVDDNCTFCLELALHFYQKSWNDFSQLNQNLSIFEFKGNKFFQSYFKDFAVNNPAGIFEVLNHYGKIFKSIVKA